MAYIVSGIFLLWKKMPKIPQTFKNLFMSVIQNYVCTSKVGLLLKIMPLCIGLAGLHRYKSPSDLSPYSMALIKGEWLQGNFTVADKSLPIFVEMK